MLKSPKDTRIYKKVGNCLIAADIYYHGANSPVIIYIHGGALIFGTRNWFPAEQIEFYLKNGFSVVNIDYRLAPETPFNEIIEDIRDAIVWVKTQTIEWYGFDVNNIAVIGSSAGGYLSLLTGTMDTKPKAIVSFYGYGDILGDWYKYPSEFYCKRPFVDREIAIKSLSDKEITDGDWARFDFYLYCRQQGKWIEEVTKLDRVNDLQKIYKYNPINNITKFFPPTLLLHGNKDTDVPIEQSILINCKLIEKDIYSKLIVIEGADHVFDQNFNDEAVQKAFMEVINFLKTNLC